VTSVLEAARLDVRPGQAEAFLGAFAQARPMIEATPGFLGLDLRRCVEEPDRFLLLVEWESVEAHTVGFRGSDRYHRWRELLHHFYDPFPVVEHYGEVR
jgi:heme-degrading monooxygenase HmoA